MTGIDRHLGALTIDRFCARDSAGGGGLDLRRYPHRTLTSWRVLLQGFSMGGGLALEALGHEAFAGRVAGIFSHGSFLSDDSPV